MYDPTDALVQTACVVTTDLVLDGPASAEPASAGDDGWVRVEVYTLAAAERILDSLPLGTRESRMVMVGQGAFVVEWRAGETGCPEDPEPVRTPPAWGLCLVLGLGLAVWAAAILLIGAYAG